VGRTLKTVEHKNILREIHRALEFYQALGVESVPIQMSEQLNFIIGGEKKYSPADLPIPELPDSRPMPGDEKLKEKQLFELRAAIGDCRRCGLAAKRTHVVFGTGSPCAKVMFVGEGPGRDEDLQGQPFVGAAGELLTKIIVAMGLKRREVYIANVVKCRPPGNRDPEPDEVETCIEFLKNQIEIIAPGVIIALGRVAAQSLFETDEKIGSLRGRFRQFHGIPVMPTYHPAYLLRYSKAKETVWKDVQQVMAMLGLKA